MVSCEGKRKTMATSASADFTDSDDACKVQETKERAFWNSLLLAERRIQSEEGVITTAEEARRAHDEAFLPEKRKLWQKLVAIHGRNVSSKSISRIYAPVMHLFGVLSPRSYETLKPLELAVAAVLETLDTDVSSAILKWLEDRQADSVMSSPRIFGILSKFLVCDKERRWETRFLKLLWNHSHGVSGSDLVFCLSRVALHYTPKPEIESQEKFMHCETSDKRATFLNACSSADIATCFSNDVNRALNKERKAYDEKVKRWAERENTWRHNWSNTVPFSRLVKALVIDFTYTDRHDTAKECLDRLDMAQHMSADLNPHESDTLASVMSTVMSLEAQTLKALKNEGELYHEAVLQVEELSDRHLQAYEAMKEEQYERFNKFFRTCQKEKEDVMKEALYKKAKYLATIKKASISGDVKLSSEDILKRMLQKAGGAFKEAEGKHKAEILEVEVKHKAEILARAQNTECALCYLKFSKTRKRACFDPCGHASACFDCATKAWVQKPNCPWCQAIIGKPIPFPANFFF